MNIDFCGPAIPQFGGVKYRIKVDNQIVSCHISEEFLQDINPVDRLDDILTQFETNKESIFSLVKKKIIEGDIIEGTILIRTTDIKY